MISFKKACELELSLAEKMVLVNISSHVDDNMKCFPSLSRLASLSGVTVRTVSNAIAKLKDYGYISIKNRTGEGNQKISNMYTLNISVIESAGVNLPAKKSSEKVVMFDSKKGFVKV